MARRSAGTERTWDPARLRETEERQIDAETEAAAETAAETETETNMESEMEA